MSHFICEYCGTEILEDKDGYYITECPHFKLEKRTQKKRKNLMKAKTVPVICDHSKNFKKCDGCNHAYPHAAVVTGCDLTCSSLGQCGITEEDILVDVQCVPVEE